MISISFIIWPSYILIMHSFVFTNQDNLFDEKMRVRYNLNIFINAKINSCFRRNLDEKIHFPERSS